ncbi:MAG: hypothetical protein E6Q34_04605 [Burkholderiaceae bacterium]|nr:MAG: hypothetical protein E6Q34_04605 [Burkholderiaceae bacterium]
MNQKAHRSQLIAAIKEKFPELRAEINQERGLLLYEVAVLIRFVQAKIDLGDRESVPVAYQLLNEFYMNGNLAVSSIIRDAVAEDLVLTQTKSLDRTWAFSLLPAALKAERKAWFEFMGYKPE